VEEEVVLIEEVVVEQVVIEKDLIVCLFLYSFTFSNIRRLPVSVQTYPITVGAGGSTGNLEQMEIQDQIQFFQQ
jgi:hypothetical protein